MSKKKLVLALLALGFAGFMVSNSALAWGDDPYWHHHGYWHHEGYWHEGPYWNNDPWAWGGDREYFSTRYSYNGCYQTRTHVERDDWGNFHRRSTTYYVC